MRSSSALLCFAFYMLGSQVARAQDLPDVAQGLTPYVGFHGGQVDQVSTLNGGLTFKIPLVSYPQKGSLSLSFSVVFNSFSFKNVTVCAASQNGSIALRYNCVQTTKVIPTGIAPMMGPTVVMDQLLSAGGVSAMEATQQPPAPNIDDRYYVIDATNAEHPLAPTSNGFQSIDESGFLFVPSISINNLQGPLGRLENDYLNDPNRLVAPAAGTITDSHGLIYTATNITDPDGNAISYQAYNGRGSDIFPVSDSTGRVIPDTTTADTGKCPTLAGANFQPVTSAALWTVPGFGGTATYLFCYASVNINTGPATASLKPYVQRTIIPLT